MDSSKDGTRRSLLVDMAGHPIILLSERFGAVPDTIVAVDGDNANRLIPKIQHVIENYKFRSLGDYRAWPGPNSNTFVQAVLDAVPELNAVLPPTAIGKDYPYEGEWLGVTPSRTGSRDYDGFTSPVDH